MKRVSKLNIGNIGKSFSIAFLLVTILWTAASYLIAGRIFTSWEILCGNLVVSAALSAVLYRWRYHQILEYDGEQFRLHTGNSTTEGRWKEFRFVSLYHRGFGIFTVRLYRDRPEGSDFNELPATDLGLEPFGFRDEVAPLLLAHQLINPSPH